ncbi:MAG: response regulator [Bacteroidota bacterium]
MNPLEFKSLKGLRVLLVDDSIFNQRYLSKILLQWQVSTDVAQNGKIALEKLSKSAYDVVLMDPVLPELNGYEATRVIRSQQRTYYRNLPIFAFNELPDSEMSVDCAMTGYINSEPLDKEELYQKISPYLK